MGRKSFPKTQYGQRRIRTAILSPRSLWLGDRIQARHFEGACILAKDVEESLELPTIILWHFIDGLDQEVLEQGQPDPSSGLSQ
jgi:hypothetical protein